MADKKALIIRGGWDGHQPIETTDLIIPKLKEAGLEVEVQESTENLDDLDRLTQFAVIIPAWTMGELPSGAESAIHKAVASGVGLAGWHGGMGDAFRSATTYQFIVGGQFVCHPGNFIDYTVNITDNTHPITQGLPESFQVHSEQYYMHVDPALNIIASTEIVAQNADGEDVCPWVRGVTQPVVWTRMHGDGRVAYSALGHNAEDFGKEPCLTLAARCILWAAGMLG